MGYAISTLAANNRRTGDCLHGQFFWAADMILVDEVSRDRLEQVIQHLLETREFASIFRRCE